MPMKFWVIVILWIKTQFLKVVWDVHMYRNCESIFQKSDFVVRSPLQNAPKVVAS